MNHRACGATLPSLDAAVWGDLVARCRRVDCEPLRPTLSRPAGPRGRPGRDPVALFRTLALQAVVGEPSIPDGVRRLRQSPAVAQLCGCTAATVPAVSTLDAFLYRTSAAAAGRHRPRGGPRHPGVTDAWDALRAQVAAESLRRAALPATGDLAADGTGLVSGAHSFCRKICACPGRGYRCRRHFSDPATLLGWDSHHHRYFVGHCAQALVVSVARHPNRHDGVALPNWLRKTQARCRRRRHPAAPAGRGHV